MGYLSESLIRIGVEAKSSEEVIQSLGELLEQNGMVKGSYIPAVIEREKIYPTGLPSNGVTVAIPHTNTSHVHKSAIAIGVLKEPVKFYMMGGTGEELQAKIVFLLAISDTKKQLELLKNLMKLFQNKEILQAVVEASTESEIFQILQEVI